MTPNVVTTVQEALGPEVLAKAGERLGEPPAALGRAVGAALPAVLWSLVQRSREPGGVDALLTAMRESGAARALSDPLGRLQPDARPDAKLVGDELPEQLAGFASIGATSSRALVAMVTPLALGALARHAPTPLNADTLGRTLREQENNIERAFPPGFAMPGVAVTTAGAEAAPSPPAPAAKAGGPPKWLWVLLAVLVLLALGFVAMRVTDGGLGPQAALAMTAGAEAGPTPDWDRAASQRSTSPVRKSGLTGWSAS